MTTERFVFLLVGASLFTIAWIVWVLAAYAWRRRAFQAQAELHGKLLDKFGTSQELLTYLETDAGQRMVKAVGDQADPAGRILTAMHTGVVLLMLGVGFLVCDGSLPGHERMGVFMAMGILSLFLGIGFLISSLLSYLFSRAWGLLGRSTSRG